MISTFVLYDGKAMWLFDPPLSQQALELLLKLIPYSFPYTCSILQFFCFYFVLLRVSYKYAKACILLVLITNQKAQKLIKKAVAL